MRPAKAHKFSEFNMLESPQDPILQEDLELIANSPTVPWKAFEGKTILITGASGLIGSQTVKAILCRNRLHASGIKVLALVRNPSKVNAVFGTLAENPSVRFIYGNVTEPLSIEESVNFIIHGASVTSSKDFVTKPVETIYTAFDGTRNLLNIAKEKAVEGFLFLSSLEVYGTFPPSQTNIGESDFGYLNPLSTRSSYSEGKRFAECMCVCYAEEFSIPVKIARLAQTFGAGVEFSDNRVFAQFVKSVLQKKDIILHTTGETERNYCYTSDAVCALLHILAQGIPGEAYNVANSKTMISIRDMAKLVTEIFPEAGIQVIFETPEDIKNLGYNPPVKICLTTQKVENLGWKASVNLREMFKRTVASMKASLS